MNSATTISSNKSEKNVIEKKCGSSLKDWTVVVLILFAASRLNYIKLHNLPIWTLLQYLQKKQRR